jgi:DNA-binding FrmR family transcriptional regulator
MPDPRDRHGGVQVDHSRQQPRLRRIEGQVRGLQQMIEEGRYCVDVAHQINAVIAALRRVQADMLGDHLKALSQAATDHKLSDVERGRFADDIASVLSKMS